MMEVVTEEKTLFEKKLEKKTIKKDAGRVGWALILYTVVLYGVVFIEAICQITWVTLKQENPSLENRWLDAWVESSGESAVSMILGVGIGTLILWLLMHDKVSMKSMFREQKKMTVKVFFQFLSVFMAVQLIISYYSNIMETILNCFGYTAVPSIEAAQSSSTTISMFLYASFVAPVVEELVYRGFLLGALKKHGKMLGIVVSAALFGIMHGNIPQAVFAFFVGMVLGVVATEYSVKWAILIHMMNNFVFGEIPHLCGVLFGEVVNTIMNVVIIYGFFIAGIVVFCKNQAKVTRYVAKHKGEGKRYVYVLTTLPILIFIIFNLWVGISQIQPL